MTIKRINLLLLCLLFAFSKLLANGDQRLLVPRIENAVIAKKGIIELPAYCSDISKTWPETGKGLNYLYWGSTETILKVVLDGKTKDISLQAALLTYHLIKIVANPRTILIQRVNNRIRLINLRSAGFIVGTTKYQPVFTREQFMDNLPSLPAYYEDEHITYYMRYQQQLWRAIYNAEKANQSLVLERLKEIADKNFRKKDLEVKLDPSGKIKIFDKGKNLKSIEDFYTYEQVELYQLKRLDVEEYEDLQVCLNFDPTDSSLLSFTISGKLKNIIPFELEYTSANKVTVTSSFSKEVKLAPGISLESSIELEVEPKEKSISLNYPLQKCELKSTGKICYPNGIEINVEVCGVSIKMKPSSFRFNDY